MLNNNFLAYTNKYQLFTSNDSVIVATSGGIDSVVLCHLMYQCKFLFHIAHCNFSLRGADSEADEAFVEQLAEDFGVPFHSISFDTKAISKTWRMSIQETARKLRYDWLETIRVAHHCQVVATAHHLNDSLETVLYNFTKGCGIRGLHGILPQTGYVVRPLLFATKAEITEFADLHDLEFRLDVSNTFDKYNRNKIRHHVVPVLQQINPNLEKTSARTIENLKEVEELYLWSIQHIQKKIFKQEQETLVVDIETLRAYPAPKSVLYESVKDLGFNADQIHQLLERTTFHSGLQFQSATHELLIDRGQFRIKPIVSANEESLFIPLAVGEFQLGQDRLVFSNISAVPIAFSKDKYVAYLTLIHLFFP
ncbi:MAG: tRNA lysidine(34) synthetase TilS [Saprospiraceae bacterium]|nr:tRNA lysidine(34) synthetase TilS [Saprospiraceae bacterium]